MANLAETISQHVELERDARKAKELLDEYQALMVKMQNYIKATGNQAQEPIAFCKTVMLAYAASKLENKIVTLEA